MKNSLAVCLVEFWPDLIYSDLVKPVTGEAINPKYRNHAITVISLFGKLWMSTKENLFDVINGMEGRYIVDNHIPWEKLSALPEHQKKAFILGTTIDKERPSSLSFFENRDGLKVRPNVFLFGMRSPRPEDVRYVGRAPQLWIEQLDEHCFDVRNRDTILAWEEAGKMWNDSESVSEDKMKILGLLGVSSIEQLRNETYSNRQAKEASLLECIRNERSKCFKDFIISIKIARLGFALLLLNHNKARNLFADSANKHVLGDMQLVQNALFWNATVLSDDEGVHMIAKYCDAGCSRKP